MMRINPNIINVEIKNCVSDRDLDELIKSLTNNLEESLLTRHNFTTNSKYKIDGQIILKLEPINWRETLKRDEIAYIAGIFDGEGTLISRYDEKNYLIASASISNSNYDLMMFLKDKIPDGHVYKHKKSKNPKHKQMYSFEITRRKTILTFIKLLKPYLIVKQEKSQKFIRDCESYICLKEDVRPLYCNLFTNTGLTQIWKVLGME
jgi:hypothetical protein